MFFKSLLIADDDHDDIELGLEDYNTIYGPWSNEELFEYADAILPEDERQGLLYAGGCVAKKMKKIDDSLGSLKDKFVPPNWLRTTCWFIDGMNRGGLLYPSEQFQWDFIVMNERFKRYHPNGKLRKGQTPCRIFF